MKNYNNVTIVARAIKNPEITKIGNVSRCTFTLAVDRPKDIKGKQGVDFINFVAYSNLGNICSEYIKKGCLCLVNGYLESHSYEINNETKWILEVVAQSVNILEYSPTKTKKEEATA